MPIAFRDVSHTYGPGTPYAFLALNHVNLEFAEGKMTAIIGQTGSGKSTLVQHLNALLLPDTGEVEVLDKVIKANEKPTHLKALRGNVGLVFQFPEYQLFEETVLKDVAFGPKNFGFTEEDSLKKAADALRLVGIEDSLFERSPLELSGGQKRRVAIAGILAMDPKVLVLDEPTAGLDPAGTQSMMQLFAMFNQKLHKTVLIVTHDMEQVYRYCDDVVVMSHGRPVVQCSKQEFFRDSSLCRENAILPPAVLRFRDLLKENGFAISDDALDGVSIAKEVARQVKAHE